MIMQMTIIVMVMKTLTTVMGGEDQETSAVLEEQRPVL